MASYFKRRGSYIVSYRLKNGFRQYVYGIKTEKLAQQSKAKKDLEEQLVQADLLQPDPHGDRVAAAARRSVAEHIDDFEQDIIARGKVERFANMQASHCRRLFRSAQVTSVALFSCSALQAALKRLLDSGL